MQAELKRLHSPDVKRLDSFGPDGPFCVPIQAMVGLVGVKAEESFDLVVCSPEWFSDNMRHNIKIGRHVIFMKEYDYKQLYDYIRVQTHNQ